ncbi:T9SS type A sorting domain-containing protein [Pontibacter sp. E15-1]|uniref:T9SS type A sorting domain-containing protein n=1 Tax=Pontibacter sp. E15-1 TaxID=2919918 RepID=UPI001F4F1654|nr:T9SS type A sorting domain-containing protein [Pontibacter sp. E15-1]MCJ8165553.1 T9SS type A sorting domain-containing protein [Pontibacter sp. E15-1]
MKKAFSKAIYTACILSFLQCLAGQALAQSRIVFSEVFSSNPTFSNDTTVAGSWSRYSNSGEAWSMLDNVQISKKSNSGKFVSGERATAFSPEITLYAGVSYTITFMYENAQNAAMRFFVKNSLGQKVLVTSYGTSRTSSLKSHTFTPTTNGIYKLGFEVNDFSGKVDVIVDDVAVNTPEPSVYYNKAASATKLTDVNSWGSKASGAGLPPLNFTAANQTFYITNYTSGATLSLDKSWSVQGTGTKIVLGNNVKPVTLVVTNGKTLAGAGLIDIMNYATLKVDASTIPTFGTLSQLSTVIFERNAPADITEGVEFGKVIFNTGNSNRLTKSLKIKGNLNLQNGKLDLGNYDLELGEGATIENGSASSYIMVTGNGRLRKALKAGEEVNLPVGRSATAYSPVKIKLATGAQDDVFSVGLVDGTYDAYDASDAPTGDIRTEYTLNKSWVVSEDVKGGSDITLTLTWPAADMLTSFDPDNCHIMHYENGAWDEYSSGFATSSTGTDGKTYYSISRPGITSFSPMGVESPRDNSPMPVELLHFAANVTKGNTVQLNWATAQERDSDFFAVERSADGIDFSEVARVQGMGNASSRSDYGYTDASPLAGTSYYRLRQVDHDGTASLLPVRAVTVGADQALALRLYPNPAHGGQVEVTATGLPEGQEATLTVTGLMGRTVLQQPLRQSAATLPTDGLKPGTYIVRVATANSLLTQKLVIR